MTTEPRFEPPTELDGNEPVLTYFPEIKMWYGHNADYVCRCLNDPYTAWLPQPPEPVKPKVYRIEGNHTTWNVLNKAGQAIARFIPNEPTAKAIAALYENPLKEQQ